MILLYILIFVVISLYIYFKHKFSYWKNLNIPFVEPIIPFGNIRPNVQLGLVFHDIYEKTKHSNLPISGAYFFTTPSVVARDLDFIKAVMVKDFDNFHTRNLYYNEKDDPLSAHLLHIEGKKWKDLRTKLTPTFTSGKMKFMFTTVVNVGQKLNETLANVVRLEGNEIQINDIIGRFTTDVIGSCAFGVECNSLKNPHAEFRLKGLKIFQLNMGLIGKLFKDTFPNFSRSIGLKAENAEATEFFSTVLKETIEYREKHNISRNDFLDIMIKFKNSDNEEEKLTFNEIAAQSYIFFGAGFETSSTTLSFCIYELARNHDIQNKAREEIKRILSKYNYELTYDALMEMKYIHQIIDETLRKYPPAPAVPRKCENDYKIAGTDIYVKKGQFVGIPIYAIHHDSNIYPDPEKFDPERFEPDAIKDRHQMAYLPFGAGPRNCIGLRFGKMQAYIGLIFLIRDFKFNISPKTSKKIEFNPQSLILSPIGGIWVNVEPC